MCLLLRLRYANKMSYPFPGFVVEGASDVDCARHVFDGERATYVPARDLVSNTRRCNGK